MKLIFPMLSALAFFALFGCSPSHQSAFVSPCPSMEAELKEKKALDARIKTLSEQLKDYRKAQDTISANSAQHRLEGMLEDQRLLKETLDRSAQACSPLAKDPIPVRDPASRDIAPK